MDLNVSPPRESEVIERRDNDECDTGREPPVVNLLMTTKRALLNQRPVCITKSQIIML